ncbi:MAG: nucleotidyltransferase family protein [Pseudomonadales bacterium]|nr:nucleotidyltransferase family protein [Pseudomonadales bacterium]
MRAMILAAGLGKRMQPLTANTPKPLLKVGDKTLIEHQIEKLVAAGVSAAVINHFYLGGMLEAALGDGSRYGLQLSYSREPILLDTAGGIIKALPKLKDDSFIVVNADIYTDFDYSSLKQVDGENCLAHLVLVANADHNPHGDFMIDEQGFVHDNPGSDDQRLTFSGISVMHRDLFKGFPIQPRSVVPLLREAMKANKVTGEYFQGQWTDVGTPERLADVNNRVSQTDSR